MNLRFLNYSTLKSIMSLRHNILSLRTGFFRIFYGMNLDPSVRISFKARLDKTNPTCIVIEEYTYIAFDAVILSHDYVTQRYSDVFLKKTHIGRNCFIGCGSIILPGIRIGDHVVVGAGSVVTKDIPSNTLVAGNPANILKNDIVTGRYGVILKK